MHAAKLETSPRLQRVYAVLADGQEHSTMEIIDKANVCAVNSCIAELREGGLEISCRHVSTFSRGAYVYKMEPPKGQVEMF